MATNTKNYRSSNSIELSTPNSYSEHPSHGKKHKQFTSNVTCQQWHTHYPATSMPIQQIYAMQANVMSIFLSQMGYSRNMPQSVMYTPESVGGLGFRHLGFEQGVQQVLHILQHLCTNTTNGWLYSLMINSYQIFAGISQPILQDTHPLLWLPNGWISSVQEFLYLTGSSIHLSEPWTPCNQQVTNQCIMDNVQNHLSPQQLTGQQHMHVPLHQYAVRNHSFQWSATTRALTQTNSSTITFHSTLVLPALPTQECLACMETHNPPNIHKRIN